MYYKEKQNQLKTKSTEKLYDFIKNLQTENNTSCAYFDCPKHKKITLKGR